MSNVSTILTQIEAQVSSVLGSSWSELDFVYDPEKNGFRTSDLHYGVGVQAGDSVSGATQSRTMDHEFFVILVKKFNPRSSGVSQRTVISALHDEMDGIDQQIFQRKLGIPNTVLVVSNISHDAPEVLSDGHVMLRANFTVKHRA